MLIMETNGKLINEKKKKINHKIKLQNNTIKKNINHEHNQHNNKMKKY